MAWDDRYYSHATHPSIPTELGKLPSVTTITGCYPKPWMFAWVMKESRLAAEKLLVKLSEGPISQEDMTGYLKGVVTAAETKRDTAADIGTQLHELIHVWAKSYHQQPTFNLMAELARKPEPVQKGFGAFLEWAQRENFRPVDTEHVVYSARHGYAGRLDITGFLGDDFALLDGKSSSDIYPEQVLQLVAYAKAYEETRPRLFGADFKPLRRLILLRLGKFDGLCEPREIDPSLVKGAFKQFLALKRTWHFSKGWEKVYKARVTVVTR